MASERVGPLRGAGGTIGPSGSGERAAGVPPIPAEITVHPTNQSAAPGETVTFTVTATGTPAPTYQWQVDAGGGFVNVIFGTGGNTNSYTTPNLTEEMNLSEYRCTASNAGGSDISNPATLLLILNQPAAEFPLISDNAFLAYELGEVGHTNLTIEMLVKLAAREDSAIILSIGHLGNGRTILIKNDNTFEQNVPCVGDSQTGADHGEWLANPVPLDVWVYMTLRSGELGGDLVATWTLAEEAAPTYTATHVNGIEDSVQAQAIYLNGGNGGPTEGGTGVQYQYVRGKTGYVADVDLAADRTSTDPTGWDFWWVFEDDGEGGIAVRDATDNGRVPSLTPGVSLELLGPITGGVL